MSEDKKEIIRRVSRQLAKEMDDIFTWALEKMPPEEHEICVCGHTRWAHFGPARDRCIGASSTSVSKIRINDDESVTVIDDVGCPCKKFETGVQA